MANSESRPTAEDRAKAKWDANADEWNQWHALGQDEKDALIQQERASSRKSRRRPVTET
jgi:hypothetical protein